MTEHEQPVADGPAPDPMPPVSPLAPGAGSPLQPGPPMSVDAPISDSIINRYALLVGVVIAVLIVVVIVVILGAVLGRR
jgi:hypothetical protein